MNEGVKDGETVYEDLTCSVEYSKWGSTKKYRPAFNAYWLRQGCGKEPINRMLFTGRTDKDGKA